MQNHSGSDLWFQEELSNANGRIVRPRRINRLPFPVETLMKFRADTFVDTRFVL